MRSCIIEFLFSDVWQKRRSQGRCPRPPCLAYQICHPEYHSTTSILVHSCPRTLFIWFPNFATSERTNLLASANSTRTPQIFSTFRLDPYPPTRLYQYPAIMHLYPSHFPPCTSPASLYCSILAFSPTFAHSTSSPIILQSRFLFFSWLNTPPGIQQLFAC